MATTDYVAPDQLERLLERLTPTTRLICEVAAATGLRIGDVVALRRRDLGEVMSIKEQKTGKKREVRLPGPLLARVRRQAGRRWVFPGGRDPDRHRTRGGVWRALKRAAGAAGVPGNVGAHSLRKFYAVGRLRTAHGSLAAVQRDMRHRDISTTMIYALADVLSAARLEGGADDGESSESDSGAAGVGQTRGRD